MKKNAIILAVMACFAISSQAVVTSAVTNRKENTSNRVVSGVGILLGTQSGEITGSGVRLRKEPGLSSKVIESLYKGQSVSVCADDPVYMDGYKWIAVQAHPSGKIGWVAAKYVYIP